MVCCVLVLVCGGFCAAVCAYVFGDGWLLAIVLCGVWVSSVVRLILYCMVLFCLVSVFALLCLVC